MVRIHIAIMELEAILDSKASAHMVGERAAKKLGVRKRARKVRVKQSDGSYLHVGNFVINCWFQVFSSAGVSLGKFSLDS